jgi:hypothetical protein
MAVVCALAGSSKTAYSGASNYRFKVKVDLEIVWKTIYSDLPGLYSDVKQVLVTLTGDQPNL